MNSITSGGLGEAGVGGAPELTIGASRKGRREIEWATSSEYRILYYPRTKSRSKTVFCNGSEGLLTSSARGSLGGLFQRSKGYLRPCAKLFQRHSYAALVFQADLDGFIYPAT